MAQTGYTPILIYSSTTASQVPSAGNLTNSTLGSELAINITDGKLFYKDNGGSVQVIAWKVTPTSAGGTGLTSYTAGDTLYYATGTTFSKLAIGSSGYYMSSSGTAPKWSAPAALTKTNDTNVTLTLGGSASTALLNAASLTLGWTGQLAATRGGTGYGSYTAGDLLYASNTTALSKLAIGTANYLLTSSGSAPQWTAGSSVSVGTASNLLSNATSGVMQIVGPAASTTRVMTIPNANFTAARTDAAQSFTGDQTLGNGNLIQGTAAKGVNFTANTPAAGMTSQLLNWYEEGTWTPTVFGSTTVGTATYTVQVGRYTRIGNTVTCHANIGISAHTGTGNVRIGGLPFTSANVNNIAYAGSFAEVGNLGLTANNVVTMYLAQNETAIYILQYPVGGGAASAVPMDTEFNIAFSITYQTA